MKDLTNLAIETCRQEGAAYADIRIVTIRGEDITVKDGNIDVMSLSTVRGFGIRAIADGGWGFAGSHDLSKDEIRNTARLAVRIAKASGSTRKDPVVLADTVPVEDEYETDIKKDPFKVPIEDKLEILTEADKRLEEAGNAIKLRRADFRAHRENKVFASSEGAYIVQVITWCGGGFSCVAVGPGVPPQTRSFPGSFGGDFSAKGYEFSEGLKLLENVENTAKEAIDLSQAPACPSDKMTLLLDGEQLVLQIHESCGHPTELDRALGTEADYAGTSFLTPDEMNKLRYGSEIVNIVADATVPGGLGTFGYDDEGVKAKKVYLVKEGMFVGYQSSRETAALIGSAESSGCMRADSPLKIPLIRMTNINLEPGEWKAEEIVEETKKGILMEVNRSWSIDDRRLNFQFGTEIGWKIDNGEIVEVLKNPTYTGLTPEFWGSCNAISRDDWKMWGTPNCGKGVPGQVMYVGHGCSTARFEEVRVGLIK